MTAAAGRVVASRVAPSAASAGGAASTARTGAASGARRTSSARRPTGRSGGRSAPAQSVTPTQELPARENPVRQTGGSAGQPNGQQKQSIKLPSLPREGVVHDASGLILGLLLWGWVVMPFLENGVPGVKKVLLAKFLNKDPDGNFLR